MPPCTECGYNATNTRVWESGGEVFCVVCDLRSRVRDAEGCETRLRASLTEAVGLLRQDAETFELYANLHEQKGTVGGARKAAVNREFAARIRTFLALQP